MLDHFASSNEEKMSTRRTWEDVCGPRINPALHGPGAGFFQKSEAVTARRDGMEDLAKRAAK